MAAKNKRVTAPESGKGPFPYRPEVVEAWVTLPDGTEEVLIPLRHRDGDRSDSARVLETHHGPYRIQLRLDWKELTTSGDPTLDADIWKDGEKYTENKRAWHHSERVQDNGEWVYQFNFEGFGFRFRLGTKNQREMQGRSRIVEPPHPIPDPTPIGIKRIFCAVCRATTDHNLGIDHNHEILAICSCDHFVKYPYTENQAELDAFISAHDAANKPHRLEELDG